MIALTVFSLPFNCCEDICALLGAANMRDIGYYFSNKDDRWKGIASTELLKEVVRMLQEKNYSIGNLDCMLCLEAPKINPYIPEMKKILADTMQISEDDISIKATTNESMGFIGREEGVVAYATVLIEKN